MLLLLILATLLNTVSFSQEFNEARYRHLAPGYSFKYLQIPPTEKFYPSRSLLECSTIAVSTRSEFFTYNKDNHICKNYSPENIMTIVSNQDKNELSYYRSREWIKTYALSMGANSLIYNSLLNINDPSTWNVDKCNGIYCPNFFRHPLLDIWKELPIDEVKLVLYKNQKAVVTMVFDGRDTTLKNWFTQTRLRSSPWGDLATDTTNFFSMEGTDNKRRFYVSNHHEGCPKDLGWLTINEAFLVCTWERSNHFPTILYSNTTSKIRWKDGLIGVADSMAIFVRLK